ncbi:ABC transporter permease [Paracoccus pacificus]|uniref:Transport permease protein n=1 Tax=Paracoccus pacificus TaxID=1463598 RepID=A0ABW4R8L1_9RHOB
MTNSNTNMELLRPAQRPGRPQPRFQMLRVIVALMLREISTTYGRSAAGYLWAILEPLAGIAFFSLIFSLIQNRPSLGTIFPLFYATGVLPFMMFNELSVKIAQSIRFSQPFMAYPNVTWVDVILARLILNVLKDLLVYAIVIVSIFVIYNATEQVDMLALLGSVGMITFLAAGVGTLNCYLMTAYPAWERIWAILTRPLFLMSGVFYLYGTMPREAQNVLWYNPLIHIVGQMRHAIYSTYDAAYVSPFYVCALSSVTLFFGVLLLSRHFRLLMEK